MVKAKHSGTSPSTQVYQCIADCGRWEVGNLGIWLIYASKNRATAHEGTLSVSVERESERHEIQRLIISPYQKLQLKSQKRGKDSQMSKMSNESHQLMQCGSTSVDELGGTWKKVRR